MKNLSMSIGMAAAGALWAYQHWNGDDVLVAVIFFGLSMLLSGRDN